MWHEWCSNSDLSHHSQSSIPLHYLGSWQKRSMSTTYVTAVNYEYKLSFKTGTNPYS